MKCHLGAAPPDRACACAVMILLAVVVLALVPAAALVAVPCAALHAEDLLHIGEHNIVLVPANSERCMHIGAFECLLNLTGGWVSVNVN